MLLQKVNLRQENLYLSIFRMQKLYNTNLSKPDVENIQIFFEKI